MTDSSFPATHIAHWPTGPVNCCERHANDLVKLSNFLGSHLAVTIPAEDGSTCKNCENEARDAEDE